ncbi:terminase, partial [Vibrio parahaemolyticus]|nr:terminase [Vibrio parahaemolyticus]
DKNVKTAEQGSKIPCAINESGQWVMMPKPMMKEKMNIPSPDRWDTYCFSQLVDYVPHEMEVTESMLESRSSVEQWVLEALESDDA